MTTRLAAAMNSPLERIGPFHYRRFTGHIPQLENGQEPTTHPVVIVGGGPVGLSVALGLANHGVRSIVIEADDSVCEGSRAACISRRSLEIVERLGAVQPFLAKGLPWVRGRSFYRDAEVLDFSMPEEATQKYPPMINLQQYYIEQYLLDTIDAHNARSPGMIEIRWDSRVSALQQKPNGVTLEIEHAQQHYRCEAQWVVACDGGQSSVRHALGLELEGTGYQGRYVIIDIELPSQMPTERRAWFDPPWFRGSTILMHRQPDNIWRIDYQLPLGVSAEAALEPAAVREFVQTHLNAIGEGHLPWEPVWTSVYRAGAMSLDSYRHDRVLFAGNAAHAMPIFGVRGLNSGFDDADNLAWKLAYVVQQAAPAALLDSYSSERVQAFHINASFAMRSTEFMSPPSRGFDLMREACLSLAQEHPSIANLVNPRQTHVIHYAGSALSSPSDELAAGPMPGAALFEVQTTDNGPHLSDVLQAEAFTVLVFDENEQLASTLLDELGAAPVKVNVVSITGGSAAKQTTPGLISLADPLGRVRATYGAQHGTIYLVRPDGHVAGRWHSASTTTLLTAIDRACARHTHPVQELAL